ncbi:hypothetical protein DL764_005836 [Monosporascus ibericus]|uniref:Uncharacterized protein n=1 Tax=Monosporascus ibericus TaxID=155417 RepID=A0A4Q4T9W3_9PEZI|nr:hypothetical protein DL764_005836 [Monosporascus ibericus]
MRIVTATTAGLVLTSTVAATALPKREAKPTDISETHKPKPVDLHAAHPVPESGEHDDAHDEKVTRAHEEWENGKYYNSEDGDGSESTSFGGPDPWRACQMM